MKPFDPDAEVLGLTLLHSILGLPSFAQKNMLNILKQEGIENLDATTWYKLKTIIPFYKRIVDDYGPNTMFDLGKSMPDHSKMPPEIDSIEEGLLSMDIGYNMNHRNGYVGFFKIISHDLEEKKIVMQCYNPYPCDFDRGIITAIARMFKTGVRVLVDENKPSRKKGGDESWYIISYR